MFTQYRSYAAYKKSVIEWSVAAGYQVKDVSFALPWSKDISPKTPLWGVFGERQATPADFQTIYSSEFFILYEKVGSDKRALRHGCPTDLQAALMKYVRDLASAQLTGQKLPTLDDEIVAKYQLLLDEVVSLDVAVWIGGQLRGSQVANGGNLFDQITDATLRTLQDFRFKPVLQRELNFARFELTIIPDLWLPVTDLDLLQRSVSHSRAYKAVKNGSVQGWFMPTVANMKNYSNPKEYFVALRQKSNISLNDREVSFFQAPTQVFIESFDKTTHHQLDGVVPTSALPVSLPTEALLIVEQLVKTIDADGFASNVTTVDSLSSPKLDAGRLSFLLATLCEYQSVTGDQQFYPAISRLHAFLYKYSEENQAVVIYGARAELYVKALPSSFSSLLLSVPVQVDILVEIQRVLTLSLLSQQELLSEDLKTMILGLFKKWQSEIKPNPVAYADLLILLDMFNLVAQRDAFIGWLGSLQSTDGSFGKAGVSYTRGVGKLAESTAAVSSSHSISRVAIDWLNTMQYTDETMYYIPVALQSKFKHGFRHDHWNRDLWLDGSAHALLACLRLGDWEGYKAHWQKCWQTDID